MNNSIIYGTVLTILLNLLNGWQDVYRATAFQAHSVFSLTAMAMTISSLIYLTCFYIVRKSEKLIPALDIFLLNIWTLGSWGGIFYALSTLPPVLVICVITASTPILTYWLDKKNRKSGHGDTFDFLICVANTIFVVLLFSEQVFSISLKEKNSAILGIIACSAAVFSDSKLVVHMKQLTERKTSSSQQLAFRFILLTFIALVISAYEKSMSISFDSIMHAAYISLLGVIPGSILLQECIKRLEPVLLEIILSTTPIFVLAFQKIAYNTPPSNIQTISCILITALSCTLVIKQFRRSKNA